MKYQLITTLAGAVALTTAAGAQQVKHSGDHERTSEAALAAQAKITRNAAQAIALRAVPNGKVEDGELERENGKLIYSFDVRVPGKTGIDEVQVSALDGSIVSHTHETPAAEARESASERAHGTPRGERGEREAKGERGEKEATRGETRTP